MTDGTPPNLSTTLITALLSGILVSILNYFFTRKKTNAEIKKLEAETEKIRVAISKSAETIGTTVSYQLTNTKEKVIYDSNNRDIGFDFRGVEGKIWKRIDGEDKAITPKGTGELRFDNDVLNIQRTNTDGRYEVWLQRYTFDGIEKQTIPQNDLITGKRGIRISCEVKVTNGEHTLKFLFKGQRTGEWLAREDRRVAENRWVPLNIYFQVDPSEDCWLRIDDQDVSVAPSSLQIRNLIILEKA